MEEKIISTMEEIEKDSKKLEQMRKINEIDELYQFFAENGYSQSLGEFKEELINFIESAKVELEGDSYLENVSGGSGIKDRLTKATSLGLASLLALGSPVSYASTSGTPGKSATTSNGWLNSSLAKKLIKIGIPASLLTVGGIGTIALIVWKSIKHNDGKKEATEHPTTIQPIDVHSDLGQIDGDNIQQSVIEGPDSPSTYSGASVISTTSTTSTPISTRSSSPVQAEESAPTVSLTTPTDPQPVAVTTTSPTGNNEPVSELPLAGGHDSSSEKKETAPSEPVASGLSQKEKENLIGEVLGEDMVEPFKKLAENDKEKVIEFVEEIKKILGEKDAKNLKQFAHDGIRLDIINSYYQTPASWVHHICNALDGYLNGEEQRTCIDFHPDSGIYALTLYSMTEGLQKGKVEKVRKCIEYLNNNLEKYTNNRRMLNGLTPDELIKEIRGLNNNKEFSSGGIYLRKGGRNERIDLFVSFVHLLYYVLKQELQGNLSGLTFKDKSFEDVLFDENLVYNNSIKFEILKSGKSIGTFEFNSSAGCYETSTLDRLDENNAAVSTYTYDPKSGAINTIKNR